jgi:hypothetical protein
MRKLIIGSLAAIVVGAASLPAAAAHVGVFVNVAPPALPYEVVPAPRPGFVWVPGVWRWHHGRHHWVAGHWIAYRPGYVYRPAGWVVYHGGWRYRPGIWVRGRF